MGSHAGFVLDLEERPSIEGFENPSIEGNVTEGRRSNAGVCGAVDNFLCRCNSNTEIKHNRPNDDAMAASPVFPHDGQNFVMEDSSLSNSLSSVSFMDELLNPRCLDNELKWEEKERDSTVRGRPPMGINAGHEDDDVSLITVSTATDSLKLPTKPSIKFVLDPVELEGAVKVALEEACWESGSQEKHIENGHQSVLKLTHLPLCSQEYQTLFCPCVKMSHLCSTDFQDDIRKLYCAICLKGNDSLGEKFLLSMMVASRTAGGAAAVKEQQFLCFQVPGLFHDGEACRCRKFELCRTQFTNLFGLSDQKMNHLVGAWLEGESASEDTSSPFCWTEQPVGYRVGGRFYNVCWND